MIDANPYTRRLRKRGWLPQRGESLEAFFARRNAELDAEAEARAARALKVSPTSERGG